MESVHQSDRAPARPSVQKHQRHPAGQPQPRSRKGDEYSRAKVDRPLRVVDANRNHNINQRQNEKA